MTAAAFRRTFARPTKRHPPDVHGRGRPSGRHRRVPPARGGRGTHERRFGAFPRVTSRPLGGSPAPVVPGPSGGARGAAVAVSMCAEPARPVPSPWVPAPGGPPGPQVCPRRVATATPAAAPAGPVPLGAVSRSSGARHACVAPRWAGRPRPPRPPSGSGLRLVPMLLLCVFAGGSWCRPGGHRPRQHRRPGPAGGVGRARGEVPGARAAPRPPVRPRPVFAGSGCCGSALHGVTAWAGRKPLVKRGCPRQGDGGPHLRGEH